MKILMKILIALMILVCRDIYAEDNRYSPIKHLTGGEELSALGVDTTDLVKIRQIADSCNHHLNGFACLFLAKHGVSDIEPQVISCFYTSIRDVKWFKMHYLLAALIALKGGGAHEYAISLLDSMLIQKAELRGKYSAEEIASAIAALFVFKDYSKFDLFKGLFTGNDKADASDIQYFYEIARDPAYERKAFDAVKDFVYYPNAEYRIEALRILHWFRFTDEIDVVYRQVAMNDPSAEARYEASDILRFKGNHIDASLCLESLIKSQLDTIYCQNALVSLSTMNSPFALAALLRLKSDLPPGSMLDKVQEAIHLYFPIGWYYDVPVGTMIDSLAGFVQQVASLVWIGNQSFVAQLSQYIVDAKNLQTAGDSVNCARKIKQFQQSIDKEYNDTLNTTTNFVTIEGWKFLYPIAQYILDRLPQIPPTGCNVKLVNSIDAKLTGGTLQYYDGSWKEAVNNNDGTFFVNTTKTSLSLRMTYEYGTQTKSNVAVGYDTIAFQTVNTKVQLQNSSGALMDTGSVQYYAGAWRNLGTTTNGIASKDLLPNTYSFRMTYAYASKDKQQDLSTNPIVVFQTVNATVQLQNSQGTLIDQGTVQYYSGAWRDLGTTTNGIATKDLLPNTYSFRMTYAYASKDKQQDISTNPTVVFQTVNAAVQLQNNQGTLIDQGMVQYYSGAWRDFGTTTNGIATKDLLPNTYSFRMTYAYASKDKQQDLSTNPIVVFQTVNAAVQLQNSQGALIDQGTVQYYSGAWRDLGTTTNGVANKELLPNSYSFRMTYAYASKDKQQDIGTNSTIVFQTVNAQVQLKNSQGNLIPAPLGDQGTVQYYSGAWRVLGTTTNGIASKELLPNNYSFRMTYEYVSIDKAQDISTNNIVSFSTVLCTIRVKNSQNQPVDGAIASYYSGAWRQIGITVNGEVTKELLPLYLSFRVKYETQQKDKQQNLSTNNFVEFTIQ
jgi:formylmethanofuran dehydrogenase subunit C